MVIEAQSKMNWQQAKARSHSSSSSSGWRSERISFSNERRSGFLGWVCSGSLATNVLVGLCN
jgi:hypothetical protein